MNQPEPKSKPEQESPSIKFLLEEYRNIATTHDHLRDVINRMFYYFLLLAAVPFTVAAIVFRDTEFDIMRLPPTMAFLLLVIGFGVLCLSLAIIAGRYRQNQYAKTVNCIRAFFADRDADIRPYLYLPTSEALPETNNLGHSFWYLLLMTVMGDSYATLAALSLLSNRWFIGLASSLSYLLSFYAFYWLMRRQYSKPLKKAESQQRNIVGEG